MLKHREAIGTVAYLGGVMALPEPFTFDWGNMLVYSQEALCKNGQFLHVDRTKKSLHSAARNELVQKMQGDWLLMYDTDLEFEPDTTARLVRMMYEHNLEVVSGMYSYKTGSVKLPVMHMWDENDQPGGIVAAWDRSKSLFQFSTAGGGCLLVRRRVFRRILDELKENPFDVMAPHPGEDIPFFKRLRALGIIPYCAWKVQCGHLDFAPAYFDPSIEFHGVYQLQEFNVHAI